MNVACVPNCINMSDVPILSMNDIFMYFYSVSFISNIIHTKSVNFRKGVMAVNP